MRLLDRYVWFTLSELGEEALKGIVLNRQFEAEVVDEDGLGLWVRLLEDPEQRREKDKPFPVMLIKHEHFSTVQFDYLPEPRPSIRGLLGKEE